MSFQNFTFVMFGRLQNTKCVGRRIFTLLKLLNKNLVSVYSLLNLNFKFCHLLLIAFIIFLRDLDRFRVLLFHNFRPGRLLFLLVFLDSLCSSFCSWFLYFFNFCLGGLGRLFLLLIGCLNILFGLRS